MLEGKADPPRGRLGAGCLVPVAGTAGTFASRTYPSAGPPLPVLSALVALSCAKIEPHRAARRITTLRSSSPPGPNPPRSIPGFDGSVEFYFDEVVSEGSQPSQGLGTSELERLILLSPSRDIPRISWKRDHISVRPKEGWRPDRVYRVQLLPGHHRPEPQPATGRGRHHVFHRRASADRYAVRACWWTGPPPARPGRPGHRDAAARQPALQGHDGFQRPATRWGPCRRADYLIYAAVDQNRNLKIDGREGWDTRRVNGGQRVGSRVLWAFPHDTVGPRIQTVTAKDSLTWKSHSPRYWIPTSASIHLDGRIQRSDSTSIPVVSALQPRLDDSVQARCAVRRIRPRRGRHQRVRGRIPQPGAWPRRQPARAGPASAGTPAADPILLWPPFSPSACARRPGSSSGSAARSPRKPASPSRCRESETPTASQRCPRGQWRSPNAGSLRRCPTDSAAAVPDSAAGDSTGSGSRNERPPPTAAIGGPVAG